MVRWCITATSRDLTSAATYTVTGTDASSGCTNTAEITVTVNNTAPTVTLTNNESGSATEGYVCEYGDQRNSGRSGFLYLVRWCIDCYLERSYLSGNIHVTGTDASSGCTNTAEITVTVNNTAPTVTLTNNESGSATEVTCVNTEISVTAGGADSYTWSDGASTATSRDLTSAATYTVTGTDASNGCTNTAEITITEDISLPTVTLTNNESGSATEVT